MSETRKLAAILAADVVGYSRLAGADEDRTLSRLRGLRSDLIDPAIAAHHGRVAKRTGDGILIEFRSVADAVRCAIEVQNGMIERNAGLPPERRIEFSVGIHLGDVVEEADGDLMGDGVNIAARLEGICKPGAICLSEQAYWQVKGRLDLKVSDLGATQLKNIAEPVHLYSLEVGVPAQAEPAASAEPFTRSVRARGVLDRWPAVAAVLLVAALAAGAHGWRSVASRAGPTAMAFCVLLAVALVPLTDWLSFREGRWAGEPRPSSFDEWRSWMAGQPPRFPEAIPDYAATANGVLFALFPDRLQLTQETIVGEKTLDETKKEIASRGGSFVPTIKLDDRDLQAADLVAADLRGVSLDAAMMRGATLADARLDGAHLSCKLEGETGGMNFVVRPIEASSKNYAGAISLVCTSLDGASLSNAQLQGANLAYAGLEGANLSDAKMQGAVLTGTHLLGASLRHTKMQGVYLEEAQLQGAGAESAQLQGADLRNAQLQGAYLPGAQLQGAYLSSAQLQGADLRNAQLQGADLRIAQFADFSPADLTDADLSGAFVFRVNIANANLTTSLIRSVRADQVKLDKDKVVSLNDADVDPWVVAATEFQKVEENKNIVRSFFKRLKVKPGFQTAADEVKWSELAKQSLTLDPDGAQYRKRLADRLGALACDPDGAPFVARRLVGGWPNNDHPGRLAALGDQLEGLRKRMKEGREKPDTCKGVAGFTEEDWRALDALKAE
jgi:uncharacterized protein YjbI with pentapeptide repeats/class 3 adenylate cyclase